jgi:23S rRNA (uracil1939-C5)-methyltransferase
VIQLAAPRLIYVSCDVATLARDAAQCLAAGSQIDRVAAFDLFPNTAHVETVLTLRRT